MHEESTRGTSMDSGYWVAAGVASIGMSSWELLNFQALVTAYDLSPVSIDPNLYMFILLASLGSLALGIAVLARHRRPSKGLAGSAALLAALGLVFFFIASGTAYSGWGMPYFLQASCVIVPSLIITIFSMRRVEHPGTPSPKQTRKIPLSKTHV